MSKIGTQLTQAQLKRATQGPPPVVMAVQATSYIRLETPEELKQWEKDLQDFYGLKSMSGLAGSASESCCSSGSDGCDLM